MLIRGLDQFPTDMGAIALTIGNFDGVHLGHQAVLDFLRNRAGEQGLPSVAMTFEPHPQEFFLGAQAPARVYRLEDKVKYLEEQGIDYVISVGFNRDFSQLQATEFVDEVLRQQLQTQLLVVGDDFRFGRKRRGDFGLLEARFRHPEQVFSAPTVTIAGERVSSTLIRARLAEHDFAAVTKLLGRPYAISGKVAHGRKLGRTLGFPTANVPLQRKVSPLRGVFAVNVLLDGQRLQGVANIGTRPTVDGVAEQLEVHLLDFDGDCYDKPIEVIFERWIRAEQKFASTDELKAQIIRDRDAALQWFAPSDSCAAT